MRNNGHWEFPEDMDVGKQGFIYVIKDLYLKKLYLGKKSFKGSGTYNKGQETNWRTYTSSSKILNYLIAARPRNEFQFICIEQYNGKGLLAYAETWSLCYVEAPTTEVWYNKLVPKVSWPVKGKITNRHKERLNDQINF